ncbi:MAG: GNVR domain-containing protein [Candidatus Omnitrophica bacterium]|nr:GNVR domain-containing protein [Candidatus Omnitrophota bacterium]
MKEPIPQSQVSIRDYLFILFHRKKYFLVPFFIVFFTASIGSFLLPKYYSSSVLILVQETKTINPLAERLSYMGAPSESLAEQLKTLIQKILNYPQLVMVIEDVGLKQRAKNMMEMEQMVRTIMRHTDVRLRSAEVFEVAYEDKDPKMAQRLVNTMVKTFVNYNAQKKEDLAMVGVKFAESQAEIYRKKLEETEQSFYEFKKKFPLQSSSRELDINVSLLINAQTSLTSTDLELKKAEQELSRVKNQLGGKEPIFLTSEELLAANPVIESLTQNIKSYQMQLYNLLETEPSSSKIPEYERMMEEYRRKLMEETEKVMDSQSLQTDPFIYRNTEQNYKEIKVQIMLLREQRTQLQQLVDYYEKRLAALPEQDREYARLSRDSKVNSNIYEMLRMKVEENRLDAVEVQQKGTQYEIIEEGRLPLKPSKPQKLVIAIVALILGVLTGMGCVFLVEFSDHSFRNVEDARKFLDVPVIGSTLKMVTGAEFAELRRKQRLAAAVVVLLVMLFIIIASVSSCIQDKKLTERIIREQIESQP